MVRGSTIALDCVSPGARPAADIRWYRDGRAVTSANIKEVVTRETGGQTFRTSVVTNYLTIRIVGTK